MNRTPEGRLPAATLARLPVYLRTISEPVAPNRAEFVSSQQLAEMSGQTSATIRHDMWLLRVSGIRGVGYSVEELHRTLVSVLGTSLSVCLAIAGAGNIGAALARYRNLGRDGFEVVAMFDTDPDLIGQEVGGITVSSADAITSLVNSLGVTIGIIATPAAAAQGVADDFVRGGVTALLNFAPARLKLPSEVHLRQVDILSDLHVLQHWVAFDDPDTT